ncbi:hypothetical protein DL96DRAFT_1606862 [Flagelloscypha sp. PMI_526]|nr:hypothetical protein DL96DRAFT_1606862 [Flagelloscypha sp. PMI_526]
MLIPAQFPVVLTCSLFLVLYQVSIATMDWSYFVGSLVCVWHSKNTARKYECYANTLECMKIVCSLWITSRL